MTSSAVDADEDVAPVVARHRLDHDGRAEIVEGIHGLLGAVHDDPLGHRDAGSQRAAAW